MRHRNPIGNPINRDAINCSTACMYCIDTLHKIEESRGDGVLFVERTNEFVVSGEAKGAYTRSRRETESE